MSSNPQFSRILLESANEAMDALVDGASEYYKSFIVLKRLHDDKGLPVDGQRMQEMSGVRGKTLCLGYLKSMYL